MRRVLFASTANLAAARDLISARSLGSVYALVLATALIGCGGGDKGSTTDDKDTSTGDDVADATTVEPDSTTTTVPPDVTTAADSDTSTTADDADSSTTSDDADTSVTEPTDVATDADADAATEVEVEEVTVDPDADTVTEPPDVEDDTDVPVVPCSGPVLEAGCPCPDDDSCASGFCAIGPTGNTCVGTCDSDAECTGGTKCVPSADGQGGVCLQPKDFLCMPCDEDTDCRAAGGTGRCQSFGIMGSFCGTPCTGDDQCPDNFYCLATQCVPDSGTCECTDVALELGASTTCRFTNGFGVCTGQRFCGPSGLTACDARTPARDICDGIDQNCNNVPDDDTTSCDDSNPCTQDVCNGANGCSHPARTGAPCNDNDACTQNDACTDQGTCGGTDTCDCDSPADCIARIPAQFDATCIDAVCNANGTCSFNPKTGTCDDDDLCTTGDTCNAGVCESTEKDCDDDNPCTDDSCDAAGACVHTARTGACEDGDPCTTGDTCTGGSCEGQTLDCSGLDDACHVGICDGNGGCAAQALTCGVTGVREHVPAASFSRKGTGATWLEGSVGHGGPIGKSSNNIHTIHFGIHPGNR